MARSRLHSLSNTLLSEQLQCVVCYSIIIAVCVAVGMIGAFLQDARWARDLAASGLAPSRRLFGHVVLSQPRPVSSSSVPMAWSRQSPSVALLGSSSATVGGMEHLRLEEENRQEQLKLNLNILSALEQQNHQLKVNLERLQSRIASIATSPTQNPTPNGSDDSVLTRLVTAVAIISLIAYAVTRVSNRALQCITPAIRRSGTRSSAAESHSHAQVQFEQVMLPMPLQCPARCSEVSMLESPGKEPPPENKDEQEADDAAPASAEKEKAEVSVAVTVTAPPESDSPADEPPGDYDLAGTQLFDSMVSEAAPKLAYHTFPGGGRGLLVTAPIEKGETVISIPRSSAILGTDGDDVNVAMREALLGSSTVSDNALLEWWRNAPEFARLAVQLVVARRSSGSPAHTAYIQCVWPPVDANTRFPRRWPNTALDSLRRPRLIAAVLKQRSEWDKLATDFAAAVTPSANVTAEEELLWAMEIVSSRSFKGDFGAGGVKNVGSFLSGLASRWISQLQNNRFDDYALLPVIDSANHDPLSKARIEYDPMTDELTVVAGASQDTGTEFCISYGDRTTDDLLQYFGFVPTDNPRDLVTVETSELPAALAFKRGGNFMRSEKAVLALIARARPELRDRPAAFAALAAAAQTASDQLQDLPEDITNAGDASRADLCTAYRHEKRRILDEVYEFCHRASEQT